MSDSDVKPVSLTEDEADLVFSGMLEAQGRPEAGGSLEEVVAHVRDLRRQCDALGDLRVGDKVILRSPYGHGVEVTMYDPDETPKTVIACTQHEFSVSGGECLRCGKNLRFVFEERTHTHEESGGAEVDTIVGEPVDLNAERAVDLNAERAARVLRRPNKDWTKCPYEVHVDDCDCGGKAGDR